MVGMWSSFAASLLVLPLVVLSVDLPPFIWGRPTRGGLVGHFHEQTVLDDPYPFLVRSNLSQPVDHFDPANTDTYLQRYWYNPNYKTDDSNNVFLMIQGEGIATDTWIGKDGYQYLQMARTHHAHVFQLEHRCFGFSRPYGDLSLKALETCTIKQALADVASFIQAMNTQYQFTNPKWVTFGGSYPGILSALFRREYPELTVGAVGSSAPLTFKFDMYEYAQSVEETLRTIDGCAEVTARAFDRVQDLTLTVEGRNILNTQLELDPPFDANVQQIDIDNLFANLFAVFQGVVQYTRDGRSVDTQTGGMTVDNLCGLMNSQDEPDIVKRLRSVVRWSNSFGGGDSTAKFPNSYSAMIATMQNTTFDDENPGQDNAALRGWIWLQCTQLAVLQTTDQGRNIFGSTVPLNYFIDMCTDAFGDFLDINEIMRRTAIPADYYGNGKYNATNVVLPNGTFDPWHKLGYYQSVPSQHLTTILMQGTAHCADMYPVYPTEPGALVAARQTIASEVAYFLQ